MSITKHEAIVSIAQTLLRSNNLPINRDTIAIEVERAFGLVVTPANYDGSDRYLRHEAESELARRYMLAEGFQQLAASDRGSRDDYGSQFNQDFRDWHNAGVES
jgi:hypothetical protein